MIMVLRPRLYRIFLPEQELAHFGADAYSKLVGSHLLFALTYHGRPYLYVRLKRIHPQDYTKASKMVGTRKPIITSTASKTVGIGK